jgi:membrane associated rhomboid family serine protease
MLILLIIIVGFAYWVSTPAERRRFFDWIVKELKKAKSTADKHRAGPQPYLDALQARTPYPIVTFAVAGMSVMTFVFMLFGGGLADPETLVKWGASYGPRTTNGEWWRIVAMMFVHGGLFQLVINMGCLVQLGMLLERYVGHAAFATVYVAAGVLAGMVSLSEYPVAVSSGASGAIFGVYGLLLATMAWGIVHTKAKNDEMTSLMHSVEPETAETSTVTIPLTALATLAPAALIFILANLASDALQGKAELAGLCAGFICGLALTKGVNEEKPAMSRAATAMAVTAVIAVVSAVPLRGVADVRPELARIVEFEGVSTSQYEKEAARFRNGGVRAESLAQVIDKSIMPELQAARTRLKALKGVPSQHQPQVEAAEEYLRLRDQSWRVRSEALRKANMVTLRKADRVEAESLEAFKKIKPIEETADPKTQPADPKAAQTDPKAKPAKQK